MFTRGELEPGSDTEKPLGNTEGSVAILECSSLPILEENIFTYSFFLLLFVYLEELLNMVQDVFTREQNSPPLK